MPPKRRGRIEHEEVSADACTDSKDCSASYFPTVSRRDCGPVLDQKPKEAVTPVLAIDVAESPDISAAWSCLPVVRHAGSPKTSPRVGFYGKEGWEFTAPTRKVVPPSPRPGLLSCERPLSDRKESCADCRELGPFMNCRIEGHMPTCRAEIFIACNACLRVLCGAHAEKCYCTERKMSISDAAFPCPTGPCLTTAVHTTTALTDTTTTAPSLYSFPPVTGRRLRAKKPSGGPGNQPALKSVAPGW